MCIPTQLAVVVFETLKRLFHQTFKSGLICFLTFPRSEHAYIYYKIVTHCDPSAPSSTTRRPLQPEHLGHHPNSTRTVVTRRYIYLYCIIYILYIYTINIAYIEVQPQKDNTFRTFLPTSINVGQFCFFFLFLLSPTMSTPAIDAYANTLLFSLIACNFTMKHK